MGKPYELARIALIIYSTKEIGARVDGFVRPSPPDVRFKDAMESACGGSSSMYSRFVRKVVVICCKLVVNCDLNGVEGGWVRALAESRWFACVLIQWVYRAKRDCGSGMYFSMRLRFFCIFVMVSCWNSLQYVSFPIGAPNMRMPVVFSV